jgi:hypothetical protein
MRLFFRFILIFGFFLTMVSCEKNSLQWNLPKAPVISAVSIIDITSTQLRVSAECTDDGYDRSVVKGFCWAFTPNPDTLSNFIKIVEPGEGIFESNIYWTSTQSIYVRAFAFNETAIAYSEQVKVDWPGGTQNNCLVNTLQATNVDFNSATVSGLVLNDGGLPLLSTGICVSSVNSIPNLSNSIVLTSQNAAVSFSMNIFSLSDSTRYYFRTFATNFADTCYGPVREFTTRNYYPLGSQGPGGGLVFFIKNDTLDGWQFLEAAPADLIGVMNWSNGYLSSTGTSNTAMGAGLSNTLAIVNQVGGFSNYAASGSLSYSNGSVSDWFLPSRDELMKLRDASSFGSLSQFGLANNYYWSSSEDLSSPNANAWCVHMQLTSGNMVLTNPKNSLFKVRPIRRFK